MPPVAVVAWIYMLGRRGRRKPTAAPEDGLDAETEDDDLPLAPGGGRERRG